MEQPNVQKVTNHCKSCPKMKFLVEKFNEEVIPEDIIKKMRKKCASCKRGNYGIYKADAILTALVLQKKIEPFSGKRNKGKKSVITEHERASIKALHQEGKTIKQLAELFKYNKNTILKILHDK